MNKARVESFSDGVFAFAITLLVLGVPLPDLPHADDQQLRTSFATILIWLNHHAMFHAIERVDHPTLILNLALLLVVSFIPFPAAVLGRYGGLPSGAFLYGCALTALGVTFSSVSFYIISRGLCRKEMITALCQQRLRNLVRTVTYPTATLLKRQSTTSQIE